MFFHLQYFFLMNGILRGGSTNIGSSGETKFPGITILTQGYDYPIPSTKKGFGFNPFKWYIPFVRLFLGHGTWLKTPLEIRGIYDPKTQENILYAMIFLFNEMAISTGAFFNEKKPHSVFHIDSRHSVGKNGWTDELHAQPKHFIDTGHVFSFCIHGDPDQIATPAEPSVKWFSSAEVWGRNRRYPRVPMRSPVQGSQGMTVNAFKSVVKMMVGLRDTTTALTWRVAPVCAAGPGPISVK